MYWSTILLLGLAYIIYYSKVHALKYLCAVQIDASVTIHETLVTLSLLS